ncbi:UNVERIFIED_CONTAM: AAA family ATPase, partial [Salmonella enterica subsp. enterica serovar Weltevreden]
SSGKSEFIALYGRRRVGKTYLVRNVFGDKITFSLTGLGRASLQQQLDNYNRAVKKQNYKYDPATSWMEAFDQISKMISKSKQKKKVIFIDELP